MQLNASFKSLNTSLTTGGCPCGPTIVPKHNIQCPSTRTHFLACPHTQPFHPKRSGSTNPLRDTIHPTLDLDNLTTNERCGLVTREEETRLYKKPLHLLKVLISSIVLVLNLQIKKMYMTKFFQYLFFIIVITDFIYRSFRYVDMKLFQNIDMTECLLGKT